MDGRNFANRLNKMSKNVLKPLIPALGLHKRVERVLYLRYIEEQSIYHIAEDVGMSFDSLNNYLSFFSSSSPRLPSKKSNEVFHQPTSL